MEFKAGEVVRLIKEGVKYYKAVVTSPVEVSNNGYIRVRVAENCAKTGAVAGNVSWCRTEFLVREEAEKPICKFKVGDKVNYSRLGTQLCFTGQVCGYSELSGHVDVKVLKAHEEDFKRLEKSGNSCALHESVLELVKEEAEPNKIQARFKVGDKVKYVMPDGQEVVLGQVVPETATMLAGQVNIKVLRALSAEYKHFEGRVEPFAEVNFELVKEEAEPAITGFKVGDVCEAYIGGLVNGLTCQLLSVSSSGFWFCKVLESEAKSGSYYAVGAEINVYSQDLKVSSRVTFEEAKQDSIEDREKDFWRSSRAYGASSTPTADAMMLRQRERLKQKRQEADNRLILANIERTVVVFQSDNRVVCGRSLVPTYLALTSETKNVKA